MTGRETQGKCPAEHLSDKSDGRVRTEGPSLLKEVRNDMQLSSSELERLKSGEAVVKNKP
ncbi:MAG: hypothetical protein U5K79_13160 [Cyclobacteriaceae bacterium]|nr:hypothetical protein [Cyclobacteriaceae bacterium]